MLTQPPGQDCGEARRARNMWLTAVDAKKPNTHHHKHHKSYLSIFYICHA